MTELINKLVDWIKVKVIEANAKGCIVGVSGGIDSAVVVLLCHKAFPNDTLGLIMPCNSSPVDRQLAELLLKKFDISFKVKDLSTTFELMNPKEGHSVDEHHEESNLKARLRMCMLYYYANLYTYLVVGTGNLSEYLLGYYTKYGDGACDIMPLGNLTKNKVYELAKELQIPKEIMERPPSAGLWHGQTDETEIGLKYEQIDKVLRMMKLSEHKRRGIPRCPI